MKNEQISVKLYNDDCLNVLSTLPDESVDLVVTDCPYKIIAGGVTIKERSDECGGILSKRVVSDGTSCSNAWVRKDGKVPDAVKNGKMFKYNDIKFNEWLPDVYRVLKNGSHCYIMINARNLKDLQTDAEKVGFKFQNILIWNKGNAVPNKYYMNAYEMILMLRKGHAKNINNMGTKNILDVKNSRINRLHPTEKPVELMKILIENSSNKNDIVLDPFMGAGSTGVASVESGRNFIGIEIDKSYYDISKQKLKDYIEE